MDKETFIKGLASKLGLSRQQTNEYFSMFLDEISEVLKTNDELKFMGFGAFKVKQTKAMTIKPPMGNKAVQVPSKRKVVFTSYEKLKTIVNGGKA